VRLRSLLALLSAIGVAASTLRRRSWRRVVRCAESSIAHRDEFLEPVATALPCFPAVGQDDDVVLVRVTIREGRRLSDV
jgi:hypothetical protein